MKEGRRVIFSKKSQSEIITTVLIILLVLAAIIIVWNVVSNLISDSAEEIESQSNPSIIRVKEFILYPNNSTDIKIIHINLISNIINYYIKMIYIITLDTYN